MPIDLNRLPDEPVVIVSYRGHISVEELHEMFARTDALIGADEPFIYRISDFRQGDFSFPQLMVAFRVIKSDEPGAPSDPRLRNVLVGSSSWGRTLVSMIKTKRVPMFPDLEAALVHIRRELELETQF